MERLSRGDVEKYGPRGSNEYAFNTDKMIPYEFQSGCLAESWDVSPDKIVFHIRPEVYWSGISINPGVMESREFTADDAVFNLKRLYDAPIGMTWKSHDYVKNIYATDKYTAVVETTRFNPEWWYHMMSGRGTVHYPPEVVEAGAGDWKNLVGTGPFVMKEHVPGAFMKYSRNPNYWRKTTIDGKEYEIPFLDELVQPVMKDKATILAALRTAKIDQWVLTEPVYYDTLAKTAPELKYTHGINNGTFIWIALRCDNEPFNNKQVRRAMFIGTNREAIRDGAFPQGFTYWWPMAPGVPGHVPKDELPASTRELFEYNPAKAKKMLADAGYPNGFEIELVVPSATARRVEASEMAIGMWEELGIKTKVIGYDRVAFQKVARTPEDYKHAIIFSGDCLLALYGLHQCYHPNGSRNCALYNNPEFTEMLDKAIATFDDEERKEMLEELFVLAHDDAAYIPIAVYNTGNYWWPWVKNYYGEVNQQHFVQPPYDSLWIDQAMKKEMGY
jgi:peptide/nickel transport system substrate-binding protein